MVGGEPPPPVLEVLVLVLDVAVVAVELCDDDEVAALELLPPLPELALPGPPPLPWHEALTKLVSTAMSHRQERPFAFSQDPIIDSPLPMRSITSDVWGAGPVRL